MSFEHIISAHAYLKNLISLVYMLQMPQPFLAPTITPLTPVPSILWSNAADHLNSNRAQ